MSASVCEKLTTNEGARTPRRIELLEKERAERLGRPAARGRASRRRGCTALPSRAKCAATPSSPTAASTPRRSRSPWRQRNSTTPSGPVDPHRLERRRQGVGLGAVRRREQEDPVLLVSQRSRSSMSSRLPTSAETENPLAIALPNVERSGSMS